MSFHRLAAAFLGAALPVTLAVGAAGTLPAVAASPHSSPRALDALHHALEVLGGEAGSRGDATLALLGLRAQLPHLDDAERQQARALFARPDAVESPDPDAGTGGQWSATDIRAAKSTCADTATYGSHPFCVHWVPEGTRSGLFSPSRQVASDSAVRATVAVLSKVWSTEIGSLAYRRPLGDGRKGEPAGSSASNRLDVYLADTGAKGIFGYAIPEGPSSAQTSAGYLVLDNDFSTQQFGDSTSSAGMRDVTAAHEFFHLVQFAYDADEGPWLMESTATWMEERVYTSVNDNRRYLASSSLRRPQQPVDTFATNDTPQYGAWVFHELLSKQLGTRVVHKIWGYAASRHGDNTRGALGSALSALGSSLTAEFRRFSAASMAPAAYWTEGSAYPSAAMARTWTLGSAGTTGQRTALIDHLASNDIELRPASTLTAPHHLRLRINAPSHEATAYILVFRQDGTLKRIPLALDSLGNRVYDVPFSIGTVTMVRLAMGNASATDDRATTFSATVVS